MSPAKEWRGYIFSRHMNGQIIPQRVQNLVIRDYAQKHGLLFLLSATEYHMDGCFMMLNASLETLDDIAGLIFYSTHQLPDDDHHRHKIFQTLLQKKKGLRFALEELELLSPEDVEIIEDIILCRRITQHYITLPQKLCNN
jgi:sporadic carbohydrate cluster protein (TIGR04323 family)